MNVIATPKGPDKDGTDIELQLLAHGRSNQLHSQIKNI